MAMQKCGLTVLGLANAQSIMHSLCCVLTLWYSQIWLYCSY